MQHFAFSRRALRLSAGLALGLLMGVPGFSGAEAATSVPDQGQHFVDCLHLLLTDGAAHARECSPSTVPSWDPLVPTTGGGPNCSLTFTSIDMKFGVQLASLGDGRDLLPSVAPAPRLVANVNPCCPDASRAPLPGDTDIASLGSLDGLLVKPATSGDVDLATNCGYPPPP